MRSLMPRMSYFCATGLSEMKVSLQMKRFRSLRIPKMASHQQVTLTSEQALVASWSNTPFRTESTATCMSLAGFLQPSNVSSRRRDTPSVDPQWSPECYASRSAFSSSLPQCNCLGTQQDGESAIQPSHRTLHIPSFHFAYFALRAVCSDA